MKKEIEVENFHNEYQEQYRQYSNEEKKFIANITEQAAVGVEIKKAQGGGAFAKGNNGAFAKTCYLYDTKFQNKEEE